MKESPAVPATITFFISTAFCTLKKIFTNILIPNF